MKLYLILILALGGCAVLRSGIAAVYDGGEQADAADPPDLGSGEDLGTDGGSPDVDAWTAPPDLGTDAGPLELDAGPAPDLGTDAGPVELDAGPPDLGPPVCYPRQPWCVSSMWACTTADGTCCNTRGATAPTFCCDSGGHWISTGICP